MNFLWSISEYLLVLNLSNLSNLNLVKSWQELKKALEAFPPSNKVLGKYPVTIFIFLALRKAELIFKFKDFSTDFLFKTCCEKIFFVLSLKSLFHITVPQEIISCFPNNSFLLVLWNSLWSTELHIYYLLVKTDIEKS